MFLPPVAPGSKARQSLPDAWAYAAGALIGAALATRSFSAGRPWGGSGLAGLAALLAWAWAGLSLEADCPACGRPVRGLSRRPWAARERHPRCGSCGRHFLFDGRELQTPPPGYVAPAPVFFVPVGEAPAFPRLCPACGRPAAGEEEAAFRAAGPAAHAWPSPRRLEAKVRVPRCGEHAGAAELGLENLAAFGGLTLKTALEGQEAGTRLALRVRSHDFFAAARETSG